MQSGAAEESKATKARNSTLTPIITLYPTSHIFKDKYGRERKRRNEILHETVEIFEISGDTIKRTAKDNLERWDVEAVERGLDAECSPKVQCFNNDLLDTAQ